MRSFDNKQIKKADNRKKQNTSDLIDLICGHTTLELGQDTGVCGSRKKHSSLSGSHGWTKKIILKRNTRQISLINGILH